MADAKVLFDRGPIAGGTAFNAPQAIITAHTPAEVDSAFAAMQQAQSDGKWLAGYLSYEFGYLASPKLEPLLPATRELPLLHFGVYDTPTAHKTLPDSPPATLDRPQPVWDFPRYKEAFQTVHDYIVAGDIYQANLTFPLTSQFTGSTEQLYAQLKQRQQVPHGAFVDLGGTALLSRSPELFFSLSTDGTLTTRPMKGTAPRGNTSAQDDAIRDALYTSEKNRAENLMIVDLLRNDMSRVSQIGSVAVPELFAVERFETLHQMTSCITSKITRGTTFKDMFAALFPCGSITGAPKVRAMQIIHEIEGQPREAYCGSIGWIAPNGSMEFNVAIRTLQCRPDNTVLMNVGGGVVYDSTARDEYDEALLKSRFTDLGLSPAFFGRSKEPGPSEHLIERATMPCPPYDPSSPDGAAGPFHNPVPDKGIPKLAKRYRIPARQGCAVRVKAGQTLTLYNPKGNQVCDFFALIDGSESEFLSMEHCRTALGRIYVQQSDVLVTNRRRSLVEIVEDSSAGVHDILIACCDHHRYQQLGAQGYHDNCADNFRRSLLAIGLQARHVPSPFNIWMNIPVAGTGAYTWEPPVSRPGDYIRLKALADAVFVMSACPQDMTPVNGIGVQPAELEFHVD